MEKKAIRAEIYIFVKKMLIAKKLKMDRNFKTFMAPEKVFQQFRRFAFDESVLRVFFVDAINEVLLTDD